VIRRAGCSFEKENFVKIAKNGSTYYTIYGKINNLIRELKSFGDYSGVDTPGLISNPEVKDACADGTWRATSRESRSLPKGFFL
jgi:hypothetical protein